VVHRGYVMAQVKSQDQVSDNATFITSTAFAALSPPFGLIKLVSFCGNKHISFITYE
jgi:hypothetical protein